MLKQCVKCIILIASFTMILSAQEPVDLQIIHKIKNEAFENSQIMETLGYLTDVFGPRLTGSLSLSCADPQTG